MKKIGFIGGDLRQLTLMKEFEDIGYDVKLFAYDGHCDGTLDDIMSSDIIVFPIPTCSSDEIFAPFSGSPLYIKDIDLPPGKIIFYAKSNDEFYKKLLKSGSKCIDYLKRDELAIKNAVPTAEGAIELAMSEIPFTISGSKVLITGYGRVAKSLARALGGLDANVCIAARKASARAEAESFGYDAIKITDIKQKLHSFDIVFNTVPSMIFTGDVISASREDTLFIDLASKPGGVDFEAAKLHRRRVIWALSLPGKVAPITAGKIVFETIKNILDEMAVIEHES